MPSLSMAEDEDDTYTIPLKDQRVFGSGIKRKRINFVPARQDAAAQKRSSTTNVSDVYLSIVMKAAASSQALTPLKSETDAFSVPSTAEATPEPVGELPGPTLFHSIDQAADAIPVCDVCHLPIKTSEPDFLPHECSIAHQLSLQHAHPPSAIDRSRKGLPMLTSQGWDPDSRTGLGARGEGILYPIKPKPKNDTAGLGLDLKNLQQASKVQKTVEKKLNAKEAREKAERDQKRTKELERIFYMNDDVEKHLGAHGLSTGVLGQEFDVKYGKKKGRR